MKSENCSPRILLVASQRLGDAVIATACLPRLKMISQNALIDVLAFTPISAEVYQYHPLIHEVFLARDHRIETLEKNYDLVIPMLRNSYIDDYLRSCSKTKAVMNKPPEIHWKDYFAKILSVFFPHFSGLITEPYQLYPQASHFEKLDALLPSSSHPLILVHMGANKTARRGAAWINHLLRWRLHAEDSKCWPLKNYFTLIKELSAAHPEWRFILTGAPSEAFMAESFRELASVINLIGKTSVLELAALLTRCQLLLSADTGPMHIACAMHTPLVALFGKTRPEISGPHPCSDRHVVLAKPSMQEITVAEVKAAVKKQLQVSLASPDFL